MTKQNLKIMLNTAMVTIDFNKKDGAKRKMLASTMPSHIKKLPPVQNTNHVTPTHIITVVDTEIDEWRSIDVSSIVSINNVEMEVTI